MCGIAGFVGVGTRSELEAMIAAIKHRGPDDGGILLRNTIGLAHARLSIIDTSQGGHQPMELPDKSVAITFNGEIYNYKELQDDVRRRGCTLRSTSDTEVLLWLYKLDGEDFLKKCVGMFALALYDFKREKLILARDRMGEKPLYWTKQRETILFASELRGLMASKRIDRKIDHAALGHYLSSDYVPTPMTMLEGVFKLEPATMLVCTQKEIEKKKYWSPPREAQNISLDDATAKLDTLLQTSVARELAASDVPTGVFLSGGLDSSAIAFYAQKSSDRPIDTFSIGFDEPSFDESGFARTVAEHLGTNHHEERLSANDALALVSEIPDVFSEPVADASVLPTMLLSRFARKSVTVALGGDGGDELFAGYPTFEADGAFTFFKGLPRPLQKLSRGIVSALPASHNNFSFTYNLKKLLSNNESNSIHRHANWLGTFDDVAQISGTALVAPKKNKILEHVDGYAREFSGDNALLWTYARTYLMDQVLVKVDRASMHYALETRAPFLDHNVVEFVFSLPYEMKYHRGTTKYIFKKLVEDKLPVRIVHRKKKGFGVPLARWLTKELRPLCEELLSSKSLSEHSLFSQSYVDQLKAEHMDGKKDNRKELWNLMVFQLWYDRWLL